MLLVGSICYCSVLGLTSSIRVHQPVSTSILSSVLGLEASNGSLFTSSSSESVLSSLSVLPELLRWTHRSTELFQICTRIQPLLILGSAINVELLREVHTHTARLLRRCYKVYCVAGS